MKSNDSVSIKNGVSRMIKQTCWDEENDIKVELNVHQFEGDEFSDEPRGDINYKSYKPSEITEAFKDFLEYVKKDYESIDLTIYSYKSEEATFTIAFHPKKIIPWTTADITPSDKNAEKLAKIQQIISP